VSRSYAPALGHLAEVEAELGETNQHSPAAFVAGSSDDPDYAAATRRAFFRDAGCSQFRHWLPAGRRRYDELVAITRRPSPTMQPNSGLLRALIRTRHSVGEMCRIRRTPRAYDLLARPSLQIKSGRTRSGGSHSCDA